MSLEADREGSDEYLLGTDPVELERLRFQHRVWMPEMHALLRRAGLAAGWTVLDLGSGPGLTTVELAMHVGPSGHVIARDLSARFLGTLGRECQRLGLTQVTPSLGPVEDLELEDASLDAAYARWLFCWLPDPEPALARVTRALRPGGRLILQEYMDWAAMRLLPPGPAFARAVQACMQAWPDGRATIDFAARVPELAARHGLVVEHFRPRARVGRPGSPEWRWLDEFLRLWLPRVVAGGRLSAAELEAWRAEWEQRAGTGYGFVATPTVADVILRKP